MISQSDEEAAVGALLLGADPANVRPEIFGISGLRQVVEAVQGLKAKGEPIDAVLLKDEMLERGTLRALGSDPNWTLLRLFEAVPHTHHIDAYLRRVAELHERRKLVAFAHKVAEEATSPSCDFAEIRERFSETLETSFEGCGFRLRSVTSDAFAAAEYELRWIVDGILVAGQPGVIGGPAKCLKTSLAIDLALSVSTGTRFLGEFETQQARVGVISGESGPSTLQDTARRICAARDIDLARSGVAWSFDIPQLSQPKHVAAVRRFVRDHGIQLLILDPLYLMLLDETTAGNASNVYAMGAVLREINQIVAETRATIVLVHHLARGASRSLGGSPAGIDALAQAGMPEFVRQWIILNRRCEYDYDGMHRLWLSFGGSAGHSGVKALDIQERDEASKGARRWGVVVRETDELQSDTANERATKLQLKRETQIEALCLEVLQTLEKGPETVTKLRDRLKRKDALRKEALPRLLGSKLIVERSLSRGHQNATGYEITSEGLHYLERKPGHVQPSSRRSNAG